MEHPLYFRRQFLVSKSAIDELQYWQKLMFGGFYIYTHPDLDITESTGPIGSLVLLGYIFDPRHPSKTNVDIMSEIVAKVISFDNLIETVKPCVGRYVIIYRDDHVFAILNDPLALREVYYCTEANKVICGSQPNLIDKYAKPTLGVTTDRDILSFYEKDMKEVRSGRLWVGDETYFTNVKHLMPNHYLDVQRRSAKRYWPKGRLEKNDLKTAVRKSCEFLRGTIMAVTTRYKVMLAVTSGYDSRSLLAASREIRGDIYYFINKEFRLTEKNADIRIPKSMFKALNIPFHVHKVESDVAEEFKKIFLNNTFMSTELILPTIYNVYYKGHQDKINLLGVGEIGREYYGKAPHDLDGYYLARCLKYINSSYATAQCEKWLLEVERLAEECNVDIMRLFLWEMLLGNWGAVGNSESDIAIEEFDPYDSHYIYEIMLSVDEKEGDLFEEMLREMWPELLDFPFNPPDGMRDWIKNWLDRIGLFQRLKRQRYRFDRWRFRRVVESASDMKD